MEHWRADMKHVGALAAGFRRNGGIQTLVTSVFHRSDSHSITLDIARMFRLSGNTNVAIIEKVA